MDYLAVMLISSAVAGIAGMMISVGRQPWFFFAGLLLVPIFWVSLCACVKRLHDLGQSGWWTLVSFIPVANVAIGIYLLFAPGQDQSNDYGPPIKKLKTTHTPRKPAAVDSSLSIASQVTAVAEHVTHDTSPTRPAKTNIEPPEEYWAQALHECESATMKAGLWAKAFAEASGDERISKATYIRLRATQLQQQRLANEQAQWMERDQELQAEQERQKAQEAELAELLAKMPEAQHAQALLPKGRCPACDAVILLDSEKCPKCTAVFSADSEWKIKPLSQREAIEQRILARYPSNGSMSSESEDEEMHPLLKVGLFLGGLAILTMAVAALHS